MMYQDQTIQYERSAAERSVLRNVYTWMALGLAITGVVAMYVASNPALMRAILSNTVLFFGLIIAQLALVFTLSSRVHTMSPTSATMAFAVYSVLNGLTLSVIFVMYTGASIAQAFFVAAGTFGALSLYAVTTKRDLGGLGQYLFAGLIGLILAVVINSFVRSSSIDLIISLFGVVLFMGLTAYDTQIIKSWARQMGPNADEATYMRVSIMGALRLYLDFINLFLYLLRFLGRRN